VKKATELVAVWGSAIVLIGIIATLLTGCKSADADDSMSAEFPTIERWWK